MTGPHSFSTWDTNAIELLGVIMRCENAAGTLFGQGVAGPLANR